MAAPRSRITGGSLAASNNCASCPLCCLPIDRTVAPTSSGATPPPSTDSRVRDRDLERDLVRGPPPPLPPRLGDSEDSLERDRLVALPPRCSVLRDLDLFFLRLVGVSCLCLSRLFCLLMVVIVGLDAFRPYRWVTCDDRFGEAEVDAGSDAEFWEATPTGGVELVTGVKTVSLLTCTSHIPVVPKRFASASNLM